MYTIGVTVAIAYELPSKPWYHYAKEIRQNIQNSAYLRRKDQNVSQLTYTDQRQRPDQTNTVYPAAAAAAPAPPARTNLLLGSANLPPATLNYNPNGYIKHPYYYKQSAGGVNVNPLNGDKPWNRMPSSPNSIYYSNPPPPPTFATQLQPVSNKLNYYFGKSPNQLATGGGGVGGGVANQLSKWMKLLPLFKPPTSPKKPIYWSDVVKG